MPLHSTALRYFVAVARARSISGAAESVHVVPSAVSRQIQMLEESIGCALFDRQARGVALTDAGERLFAWAVEAQRHADNIIRELKGAGAQRANTIRVACTDAFTTGFMSRVIAGFRERHPDVFIHMSVGKPLEISQWLQSGEVDCGLKFGIEFERDANLVYTDRAPILAIVSPKHPLAERRSVLLRQLVCYPLALPGAETTIHRALNAACQAENLQYQDLYSGNASTLLSLAALGDAVVLVGDFAARGFVNAGSLKSVVIQQPLFESRRVMLMVSPRRTLCSLAEEFVSDVADEMRLYSPEAMAGAPR